ncbi:MAG TPA: RDD family protein [Candidatus Polarisedimenticolia bacterium]|nr:RDD family protein [Candidatus Polarisedimenticolia bacterium]
MLAERIEYAGFWRRFGAYWLDALIFVPPYLIAYFLLGQQFRLAPVYLFLPTQLFGLWYYVLLVARYGGTPGKLLLHTRINMVDGSPVTLKAACLRYGVTFVVGIPVAVAALIPTMQLTDAEYFAMSFLQRSRRIQELAPTWQPYAQWILYAWSFSEFLTMMFNERRRALHDLIGGTVVIKKWREGYAPVSEAASM